MARIGFIGLGRMGLPMAANLAGGGHDVRGHDTAAPRVSEAERRGVTPAASSAEAAADADFVVTMLATGRDVGQVLVDGDRVLDRVAARTVVIDASTTDLGTTDRIHAAAAERGVALIDSPVSGGTAGAEAGTLTFMAGGDAGAIDRAEPLYELMGRRLVRAGGPGAGQAVKVCNNLLLGVSMIGVCEAMALGEAAGVERQVLFDVMSAATGRCWALTDNCPAPGVVEAAPSSRGYEPGFTARLMLKDLGLAQEAAARTGAGAPLGEQARALYERFCAEHDGELDFSAIMLMLRGARGR